MGKAMTKEPQYQMHLDAARERGFERLGLRGSESWHEDRDLRQRLGGDGEPRPWGESGKSIGRQT